MEVEWHGLRLKPAPATLELDSAEDRSTPAWRGPLELSAWDCFFVVLAIISIVLDILSDCYVAYAHALNERMMMMWFTIAFIVLPAWISTWTSLLMILQDRRNNVKTQWSWRWITLFHILPLVLVPRYINSLNFGLKSQQKTRPKVERQVFYYRMLWEDYDAAYLRLIEAFLEACPQLLIQSVFVFHMYSELRDETSYFYLHVAIPMVLSLFSLAHAVVCYKRSLRISQNEKRLSWSGTVTLLCSQICLISSRVIVLTLFLVAVPIPIITGVLLARLLFNMTWLYLFLEFDHVDSKLEAFVLRGILSLMYLFTYVDFCRGNTGKRHIVHHLASVVDCAVLLTLYQLYAYHANVYCIVAAICLYPLGLMLLVFYYCKCHPTSMSDGVHIIHVEQPL